MDSAIERFEVDEVKVSIYQDDDPMSPREENQLAVLVCNHPRYSLGDRTPEFDEQEALERGGFALLERYLRMTRGVIAFVKLGLLDHSGVHIYANGGAHWSDAQGWDSGTVGYVYVTAARCEELGAPLDSAERRMLAEIEEYDQYLRGDVYGYVCEAPDGSEDSCWGFYGMDFATEEATRAAKSLAEDSAESYATMLSGRTR